MSVPPPRAAMEPSPALRLTRRAVRGVLDAAFRVEVRGLSQVPTEGPVLLAGNHTGFLDGPVTYLVVPRPSAFLAKSELYSGPWAPVLRWAGQVPIRRGSPDRTALATALSVLDAGGVLGMFPEGTRGSGELTAIQHGIGYLALRSGCPVVPVACDGTADALPKGTFLPRWRSPLTVTFGQKFHVQVEGDSRARASVAQAAEQIRHRLLDHVHAARAAEAA